MKNLALAKLQQLCTARTLAHAWLFVGNDQDAMLNMATEFSQWLLCFNPQDNRACGTCNTCNLFTAQTHPDFCSITPAADKHTIAIDDVRMVTEFATAKPQFKQHKIVLLYPAAALNTQAANALLKSLEEPPSDTIYILITKHVDLLPKTIVSRCQVWHFAALPQKQARAAEISKQMVTDLVKLWIEKSLTVVQTVDQWLKQWPDEVLYCFEIVLTDIIRFKYTQDISLAQHWHTEEAKLSATLTASKFWTILERLQRAQHMLGKNQNPNMQLLLENVLLV